MKLDSIIEKMRTIFITEDVFDLRLAPIERIVYGFVGLILVAVATGIISLVIVRIK